MDSLLKGKEQYPPPAGFRKDAAVRDDSFRVDAGKEPEDFWARMAATLELIAPWSKVLDWDPPFAKWFVGGRLTVTANCLDRHLRRPRLHKHPLPRGRETVDRFALTSHSARPR